MTELFHVLRDSLTSLEVPASWFKNPRGIAEAVLEIHNAARVIDKQRPVLTPYVDDVVDHLEVLTANDAQYACPWVGRLTKALPDGAREQIKTLTTLAALIRGVETYSAETENALSKLIYELSIPVRLDLPASTVPKLVRLARVVAQSGPMRPGWFEPCNWTKLRQVCDAAFGRLDAATTAASRVTGVIPSDRLGEFSESVNDLESVETAWQRICNFVSRGTGEELELLAQSADDAFRAIGRVADATTSLAKGLALIDGAELSLRSARSLAESMGAVAEAGPIHGLWSDSSTRSRVRAACDEIISDLTEASDLKQTLQERMSHRAFKSTAAELAGRSTAYGSLLKRLFGGFAAFRVDAAELYKTDLPNTTTLLADCTRLRTFHRRLNDAHDAAAELVGVIPQGCVADDPASWKLVLGAISAFETVMDAVSELPASFHPTEVELDRASVQAAKERFFAEADSFRLIIEESPIPGIYSDITTIGALAGEIRSIADAAKICRQTWGRTVAYFETPPADFASLIADAYNARHHSEALAEVSRIFDREPDVMPRGSLATDRASWEQLHAGVDAAERLSGLVRPPETLRHVLCVEGRIDYGALLVAADMADAAYQKLASAWQMAGAHITLSPPDEPIIEPSRRPLAVLRVIAATAAVSWFSGKWNFG